jgi:L-cystine transport system substrate-binding protein
MKKRGYIMFSLLVLAAALWAEGKADTGTTTTGVRKILVAIIGVVPQMQYEDENGNLTGYEIEILRAIDESLPQYEFVYEKHDFQDALISVENGKADISVCQWTPTPARQGRFLFSDPYQGHSIYTAVDSANTELVNSIKTIDDLAGLVIKSVPGNDATQALEAYNRDHPNKPIIIDTGMGGLDLIVADFKSGAIDGYVTNQNSVDSINGNFDIKLVFAGEPIVSNTASFALNLRDTQLNSDINRSLEQLKASGRLSQLALQFVGTDISVL